jgi:hypothetical protein
MSIGIGEQKANIVTPMISFVCDQYATNKKSSPLAKILWHLLTCLFSLFYMVRPEGFEPPAY